LALVLLKFFLFGTPFPWLPPPTPPITGMLFLIYFNGKFSFRLLFY
jgi:hypothetical protein